MISFKKYHTLVFVGRFQPIHQAHAEIIRRAATIAKQLIIIVGSANQPRTYKNPWTSKEREMMLQNVINDLHDSNQCMIRVEHNIDTIYNDTAWVGRVQSIVAKHTQPGDKVGVIGHKKADTVAYLRMFPQWGMEEIEEIEPLNATNIRDLYFRRDINMNFIRGVVPQPVYRMLEGWVESSERESIIQEREFIEIYKRQFLSLAYPPIFVTTDALVVCSGHILLVERKSYPGKGLFALPGGFLNSNEHIIDGVIRELREETRIKVPAPVLMGSIKKTQVFDHPDRSARGRTITHCFLIELPDGELPQVKGSDDAKTAQWVPISQISSANMFEDHYQLIQEMVGIPL